MADDIDALLSSIRDELSPEIAELEDERIRDFLGVDLSVPQVRRKPVSPAKKTTLPDSLSGYLRSISRTPLLTASEELELASSIEVGLIAQHHIDLGSYESRFERHLLETLASDGRGAKERMVCANLRLVVAISRRYHSVDMPLLDLIQEGNIGLIRAVEKFDHKRGFRFSTYATWWIRQAVTRGIADRARIIRLPVHVVESINKLTSIERDFEDRIGRQLTVTELSTALDLDELKVRELSGYRQRVLSLDAPIGSGDAVLGEIVDDFYALSDFDVAYHSLLQEEMGRTMSRLTEREARVLTLRNGLSGGERLTLEEIGKIYGLTRERIRQIESKAVKSLLAAGKEGTLGSYTD